MSAVRSPQWMHRIDPAGFQGFWLACDRVEVRTPSILEVIAEHWTAMGTLIEAQVDGPWMFAVTNDGLRALDL